MLRDWPNYLLKQLKRAFFGYPNNYIWSSLKCAFQTEKQAINGSPVLKSTNEQAKPSHQLMALITPIMLLLWLAVSSGCSSSSDGPNDSVSAGGAKPQIVTTTGMVRDMVQTLVGTDAEVTAIMGPGVDPHLYQPSRGDSIKLLEADIVIYNGLHLEGRLGEVLEARAESNNATVAVAETLDESELLDADAGLHDPHIWMNVALWKDAAANVASALADRMPEHADAIFERLMRSLTGSSKGDQSHSSSSSNADQYKNALRVELQQIFNQ